MSKLERIEELNKAPADYQTWVYILKDGAVDGKVVSAPEAIKLLNEGWESSPALCKDDSPSALAKQDMADNIAELVKVTDSDLAMVERNKGIVADLEKKEAAKKDKPKKKAGRPKKVKK